MTASNTESGQPLSKHGLSSGLPHHHSHSISSAQLITATTACLLAFLTLLGITYQLNQFLTPPSNPQVAGLSTQPLPSSTPHSTRKPLVDPTEASTSGNPFTRTPPPSSHPTYPPTSLH